MSAIHKGKILIVDDEPSSLELLDVYLQDKGYQVQCAVNGHECVDKVRSFDPEVVVLDVRLPDRDGIDILREMKTHPQPPYVIIVTAFHDMGTTIKAIRAGAFEYIPKPIDVDELEGAIERALALAGKHRAALGKTPRPARDFHKDEIIGNTREMNEIFKTIGVLSANRVTVLIQGETGTGKELVARAIHFHGADKDAPFIAINCSAIVENLLESELFGHEKGAFTGAVSSKKGLLEMAQNGTVFLDEVGEMPLELQVKLLRVLQEREFQRVGGEKVMTLEARIIASTNRDLSLMVREGTFREDLYYRLSVATIHIPPLRDRKSDIPLIVDHLVSKINIELKDRITGVEALAIQRMTAHDWPGNIRELENILTKAALLTKGDIIVDDVIASFLPQDKGTGDQAENGGGPAQPATEKERILWTLNQVRWHYGRACEMLGISRPTLSKKMKEYGIPPKSRQSLPG